MAEFLRTHGFVSAITELIEEAVTKVVFESSGLKVSPEFLERIRQGIKEV